jgi:cold-inducible RNA-binding protein
MAKKLYVGGLPYETTQDELETLFKQAGDVMSAVIIMHPANGEMQGSKGFGFVEFTEDADADKAIEMFNGYELGGRNLIVNEARPREEKRPGGGYNGGGNRGGGFGGGSRGPRY